MQRIAAISLLVLCAAGFAHAGETEESFYTKPEAVYRIPTSPDGTPIDTVVGALRPYRIRKGDTLIDLARTYALGYNEIVEANPGLDPWVPPAGAVILLPTEYVLPCCQYNGIVVNIPEMRLYLYERSKADPTTTLLYTYPVGLGRDDWPTPRAKFRVRGKTINPQWNIPESIRKEHIRERGDDRTFIPGGAEDNPLGNRRIELTLPSYGIHGTDIPWGVGMLVSHGCIRLYPEDIERLFPRVAVGTAGELTYQPIKIGHKGDQLYLEAHDDIYRLYPAIFEEARSVLARRGITQVTQDELVNALRDSEGMPIVVTTLPTATVAMTGTETDIGR